MMKGISYGCYAHIGRRPNQEDTIDADVRNGVYCLCDGMGGHSDGEKASKLIAAAFLYEDFSWESQQRNVPRFRGVTSKTIQRLFVDGLTDANEKLRMAKDAGFIAADAGCTLVAVCICEKRAYFMSIGDSLILVKKKRGGLDFYNKDVHDTKENDYIRNMRIPRDEARRLPNSQALTQAVVGRKLPAPADMHIFPSDGLALERGDRIILASDGLETLDPRSDGRFEAVEDILSQLPEPRPDAEDMNRISRRTAQYLVSAVLDQKTSNQDNVSVSVIEIPSEYGATSIPDRPANLSDEVRVERRPAPEHYSESASAGLSPASAAAGIRYIIASIAFLLIAFALGFFTCLYFFDSEDDAAESQTTAQGEAPKKGQTTAQGETPKEGQTTAQGETPKAGQTTAQGGASKEEQTTTQGEAPKAGQTTARDEISKKEQEKGQKLDQDQNLNQEETISAKGGQNDQQEISNGSPTNARVNKPVDIEKDASVDGGGEPQMEAGDNGKSGDKKQESPTMKGSDDNAEVIVEPRIVS